MHPTESELLALVHRECSADRAVEVRMHLAECNPCRSRYDTLVRADRQVASLLAVLDHPVPSVPLTAVRRPRRFLRYPRALAAGIAALLAVAGAAAAAVPGSPLHSWIQALAGWHAPAQNPGPAPAPAPPASTGVTVTVDMTVIVVLRHSQPAGEIRLTRSDRRAASVRAFGGDVGYTVRAGRIIVENRTPAARYEIALPRRLREATLVVGEQVLWRASIAYALPTSVPDTLVFNLSDSRRAQP